MNRSTMLRLARLEAKRREEPIILHFAHPNPSVRHARHGKAFLSLDQRAEA